MSLVQTFIIKHLADINLLKLKLKFCIFMQGLKHKLTLENVKLNETIKITNAKKAFVMTTILDC